MRRGIWTATVVTALLLAAGCTSHTTNQGSTTTTTITTHVAPSPIVKTTGGLPKSELRSLLLPATTIGAGWVAHTSTGGTSVKPTAGTCFADALPPKGHSKDSVNEKFLNSGTSAGLLEELAAGSRAEERWSTGLVKVANCRTVTLTTPSGRVRGTIGGLVLGKFSAPTRAYVISIASGGGHISYDTVAFKVGRIIGEIEIVGVSMADVTELKAVAEKAIAKVKAGGHA